MQETLFGEKKQEEKKEFSKPKKAEMPSNVFVEDLKDIEKEETFAAAYVRRITKSTLDEKKIIIDVSQQYTIKPYPQERSCYGGFWGSGNTYTEETLQNLLQDLLNFKKEMLELPYTDDLKNADRYTNLKAANVIVVITDETKKYIENATKTKWEDLLKKLNEIKNKTIPEGYNSLVQEEYGLEKEIDVKKKEVSDLKENYVKIIEEDSLNLMTFDKDPTEIYNAWKKAKIDLANLERKLKEIRNKIDNAANKGDAE